jgi:hypothetical protein
VLVAPGARQAAAGGQRPAARLAGAASIARRSAAPDPLIGPRPGADPDARMRGIRGQRPGRGRGAASRCGVEGRGQGGDPMAALLRMMPPPPRPPAGSPRRQGQARPSDAFVPLSAPRLAGRTPRTPGAQRCPKARRTQHWQAEGRAAGRPERPRQRLGGHRDFFHAHITCAHPPPTAPDNWHTHQHSRPPARPRQRVRRAAAGAINRVHASGVAAAGPGGPAAGGGPLGLPTHRLLEPRMPCVPVRAGRRAGAAAPAGGPGAPNPGIRRRPRATYGGAAAAGAPRGRPGARARAQLRRAARRPATHAGCNRRAASAGSRPAPPLKLSASRALILRRPPARADPCAPATPR